jgi:hypothetical protein
LKQFGYRLLLRCAFDGEEVTLRRGGNIMVMNSENAVKLAVLIDADDAQPGIAEGLLAEVAKYGTEHVKRAYGDWTGTSLRGWKDHLLAQSIQPIQQFAYTKGTNATDAAMVIDAMDLPSCGPTRCAQVEPDTLSSPVTLQTWRARATPADPAERALRQAVLRTFATTGAAPDSAALEHIIAPFGIPAAHVPSRLHARDVRRLGPDGRIYAAYPFSAVPTRHRVLLTDDPSVSSVKTGQDQ